MATPPTTGSVVSPRLSTLDYNFAAAPGSVPVNPNDTPELPDDPTPAPLAASMADSTDPTPRPRAKPPAVGSPTDPRNLIQPSIGRAAGLRAAAVASPRSNPAQPSWKVDAQNSNASSVMNAQDRAVMRDLMTTRAGQATVDYITRRTAEVGPKFLAEMDTYLSYETNRGSPATTYTAIQTLQRGGVCRDQMGFMNAVLNANGYESRLIGYDSADGISHAFAVYRDPVTKKWNALEYDKVHELQANTAAEALRMMVPGALSFDVYENKGFGATSTVSKVYTDAGLRLFGAMSASDQPAPIGQSGASVSTDGVAATVAVTRNINMFARAFRGNGLNGTVLGGAALRLGNNVTATVGGGQMSVEERSVGSRRLFEENYNLAFASLQAQDDLFSRELAQGLRFESDYDMALNVGAAFGSDGLDESMTAGLMDVRGNFNARIAKDVAPGVQAYAGGTVGLGTASLNYFATGGRNVGDIPFNRRVEAGVDFTRDNMFASIHGELPMGKQADNLHNRPAVDFNAGYLRGPWALSVGARISIGDRSTEYLPAAPTNEPQLDVVYAGAYRKFGAFTAGVDAYMGTQTGQSSNGVQVSLRMNTSTISDAIGSILR